MEIIKLKPGEFFPENYTGIVEYPDGTKYWYKKGRFYREDGPAIESPDGEKYWYKEGKYHRLDGPAIEYPDGTNYWFKEGWYHRKDGPAIKYANGSTEWWYEGKRHREGGPAIESPNGTKEWYKEGELHRENGPAIEWGNNITSYWIDDIDHYSSHLDFLIKNQVFLGVEIGKYGLEWLRFMTETGIEEFPNFRNLKEIDIQKEMKIK